MRCISPGFGLVALVWCIAWQSQLSAVDARLDTICSMSLCENKGWYCNRAKDPCPVCLILDTVNNVVQCRGKDRVTGQCPDGYSTCASRATNTSSSSPSSTSSNGSGSMVTSNRDDSSSSNLPPTNEATTLPSATSPAPLSAPMPTTTGTKSSADATTGTASSKKGGLSTMGIVLIGLAIGAVAGVGVGFVVMRRKAAQRKEVIATPQDKFHSLDSAEFSPSSTPMSEPSKQSVQPPRSTPPPRSNPAPPPQYLHDDSIESAIVPPPENLAHLDSSDIDTCDFTATGNAGMFVTSSRSDSTDWMYSTRCDNNHSNISSEGEDGFVVFTDTNPRAVSESSEPDEDDDDFYPDTDAYCADSTVPNKYLELAVESLNKKDKPSNFERQLELDAASHGPSDHDHDDDLSTARAVQFLDDDDDLVTTRDTEFNATDMIVDLSRRHPETMPGIKRDKKERLARWKDKYYLEL